MDDKQNNNDINGNDNNNKNKKNPKSMIVLIVISVVLTLLFWKVYNRISDGRTDEAPYSQFVQALDAGEISEVEVYSSQIKWVPKQGTGILSKTTYVTVPVWR